MPDDGGVDVISGACKPVPSPKPSPKPKKKPELLKIGDNKGKTGEQYEDCGTERVLGIKPGVCTWFLVEIRGKRLSLRARKAVGSMIKKLVAEHCKSVPTHKEP
jgi:hypothetical protein